MKKWLLILPIIIVPWLALSAPERLGVGTLVVTTVSSNIPVSLTTGTNLFVTRVTLLGLKAERTTNTHNVWVGTLTNNNTQPLIVTLGAKVDLEAAPGTSFNLKDLYLDSNHDADGLVILYQAW